MASQPSSLILLARGSQDSRWHKPFSALNQKLAQELGPQKVQLAYLEASQPDMVSVGQEAVAQGIRTVVILPLFLALDQGLEQEIPRQVVKVKERFPELNVILLPPIGEHPTVSEAICAVARVSIAD